MCKKEKLIFVAAWEYPPIMSGESVVCRRPGKIYGYMSTGKPIMCICDGDSATADAANAAGCTIVSPSGDEVCKVLRLILLKKPTADLQLYDAFCLKRHENKPDQAIARLLK